MAELHGVKLSVLYKNRNQCTEFLKYIDQVLFDKNVGNKLEGINFIAVFCDGSTDAAIIEKEYIYIMFCYPDTFEPVLTFFSLKDLPSQDVTGVRCAINAALNNISMPELASKVVFLASDGPSLVFVWCLSHRLEPWKII